MRRPKRLPKTSIFIACEGRNTEPLYFERIKEEVEDRGGLAITIYPDKSEPNPKSDAVGLVTVALEQCEYFDEVWVVFDKDGYTKHGEAFALAEDDSRENRPQIAFSSICFEHWILLHFEKNADQFMKSDDIIGLKLDCKGGHCIGYSKNAAYDLYGTLREKTGDAILNATWLRYFQGSLLSRAPVYDVNPYTDVDILVRRLLGVDESVAWYSFDEIASYRKFDVTITEDRSGIHFKIENKRESRIFSTEFEFFFTDITGISESITPPRQEIHAKTEEDINLGPSRNDLELVRIQFENFTAHFVRPSSHLSRE